MPSPLPLVEAQLRSRIAAGRRILIAVSGGPDSVALAHMARRFPYELVLGHVDHQLRKGSWRDARFVQDLAARWDLPCTVAKVHVPSHAAAHGLGLEEAARELRYKALRRMAVQSKCSALLTAHTADDQAETVLMNFLRGAGPAGLAGIPPARELAPGLPLLRPLLGMTRPEILTYLREHRLRYRTDPTNRQRRFTRNRIRRETLPYLQKEFPGLSQRLLQLGSILREEEAFWDSRIDREYKKTVRKNGQTILVDLTRLLGYHKALGRRIFRRAVGAVPFQDVERLLTWAGSSNGSPSLQLVGGIQVTRKGLKLCIRSGK